MGYFTTYTDKGGKFRFNLKAGNGQIILTSQGYKTASGRDNGIASVQKNSQVDGRFEDRESSKGEPYFVLKAGNGEVIGNSEMYSSNSAKNNGIASVKKNGSSTDIREA